MSFDIQPEQSEKDDPISKKIDCSNLQVARYNTVFFDQLIRTYGLLVKMCRESVDLGLIPGEFLQGAETLCRP